MSSRPASILIADDDPSVLDLLKLRLERWGYRVASVSTKAELIREIARRAPDLLLLDVRFGEHDGVELMRDLLQRDPSLSVVLLTAFGTIDSAVAALKLGAHDYLTKPCDFHRLRLVLEDGLDRRTQSPRPPQPPPLPAVAAPAPAPVPAPSSPITAPTAGFPAESNAWSINGRPMLLGQSAAMRGLRDAIERVADTDATVLILGESGTGKELAARALHHLSRRRDRPFVPVNMAALPRELIESVLFGHIKGAFTGADRDQTGCCQAADTGTLFLDEIGDMDVLLQAKLLRFLQEQTIQRVGESKAIQIDARIIAATNLDLRHQVSRGLFREDLFYRLNVVPIRMPSLRERTDDVPILAREFLRAAASKHRKPIIGFTSQALDRLLVHDWPGNVRELKNLVERLVIFCPGQWIEAELLPPEIDQERSPIRAAAPGLSVSSASKPHSFVNGPAPAIDAIASSFAHPSTFVNDASWPNPSAGIATIDELERQAIIGALIKSQANVVEAAKALGMSKATIYRKIKRYQIKFGRGLGMRPNDGAPGDGGSASDEDASL